MNRFTTGTEVNLLIHLPGAMTPMYLHGRVVDQIPAGKRLSQIQENQYIQEGMKGINHHAWPYDRLVIKRTRVRHEPARYLLVPEQDDETITITAKE